MTTVKLIRLAVILGILSLGGAAGCGDNDPATDPSAAADAGVQIDCSSNGLVEDIHYGPAGQWTATICAGDAGTVTK